MGVFRTDERMALDRCEVVVVLRKQLSGGREQKGRLVPNSENPHLST